MDMVQMFEKYQNIYEVREKYKKMEIFNDSKSWKRVYNEIVKFLRNGQWTDKEDY